MAIIDSTKVKNLAEKDLILRFAEIAKSELYGYNKPKYTVSQLLRNFTMIESIEDAASNDIKNCVALALDKRIDKRLLQHWTSTAVGAGTTLITTPAGGSCSAGGYQGTIASEAEMLQVYQAANTDGWWWSITGDFVFMSVEYFTGEEVFWESSDFNKSGNFNEYARIIVNPANTSRTADGNWRMIVDGTDKFLIQKRISGSWSTRQTIS